MSADLDLATVKFHAERAEFYRSVEAVGMTREHANYCITVAVRLRAIYEKSERVAELEDEELRKLRNVLHRMEAGWSEEAQRVVKWECICGGLEETDNNVLYIVPPGISPLAVPMKPKAQEAAQETVAAPVSWAQLAEGLNVSGSASTGIDAISPEMLERINRYWQQAVGLEARQMAQISSRRDWWTTQYQTIPDSRAAQVRRRIEQAADREGWGPEIRSSEDYKLLREALVHTEEFREQGDSRATHWEARAREVFERIKRKQAAEAPQMSASMRDVMIRYPDFDLPGHKQLQEMNERKKRRGRYAK